MACVHDAAAWHCIAGGALGHGLAQPAAGVTGRLGATGKSLGAASSPAQPGTAGRRGWRRAGGAGPGLPCAAQKVGRRRT